jgi:hypothetical protein
MNAYNEYHDSNTKHLLPHFLTASLAGYPMSWLVCNPKSSTMPWFIISFPKKSIDLLVGGFKHEFYFP